MMRAPLLWQSVPIWPQLIEFTSLLNPSVFVCMHARTCYSMSIHVQQSYVGHVAECAVL